MTDAERLDIEDRKRRRAALAAKPRHWLCRLGLHRWRNDTSILLADWAGGGESCARCGDYRDSCNRGR